jgi:gas vesicle protein
VVVDFEEVVYVDTTGAIIALLFAPESGQELRANIRATADKDLGKLQAEWQTAMAKTHERLDQMQAGLDTAPSQTQSEGGDAG